MSANDFQGAREGDHHQQDHLKELLQRLQVKRRSGGGWMCLCPGHDDRSPSLSVSEADNGGILVHCFAGCETEAVLAVIGLEMSILAGTGSGRPCSPQRPLKRRRTKAWPTPEAAAAAAARAVGGTVADLHCYEDRNGDVSLVMARIHTAEGKTFRPFHPEPDGWRVGDPDFMLSPYRLTQLAEATEVLVVEGERCVEAAERFGIVATTSAHGSRSASRTDWSALIGKVVTIWPDNDEPGQGYVECVAQQIRRLDPNARIRTLAPAGLPVGGDIIDWIAACERNGCAGADLEERLACLLYDATELQDVGEPTCAGSAGSAGGGVRPAWSDPQPIEARVRLPQFPIDDAFPPHLHWVRDYILAIADCHQVPVDGVAMLTLPTMALGLAKRFAIEPQPGWREQLSLYVVVLLPSGERKTAVVRELTKPIYAWQRDVATGMQDEILRIQNEEEVVRGRLNRARNAAARAGDGDLGDIHDIMRSLAELESSKPTPPRMIVTEGTAEAIAEVLVKNHEVAMLAAAEGDAFDIMLGRYSGSPNFGVWLSGHSGDPVDSVRRGREADRLENPALQVALCIQPAAVADLLSSPAANGRGVLARFFFAVPESKVGFRELVPPPIPTTLVDHFGTRMQTNLSIPIPSEPRIITLSEEAREMFTAYRQRNEVSLRPDGELSLVRSWGSKLPGGLARIAGILRMFDTPDARVIDATTMRCALCLHEYLFAHYSHVAVLAGDDAVIDLARRIDAWIRTKRVRSFTLRDAFDKVRRKGMKAQELEPALELLEDRRRIRRQPPPVKTGGGRPPSPSFEVNPSLSGMGCPLPQNPQNPQNSPSAGGEK